MTVEITRVLNSCPNCDRRLFKVTRSNAQGRTFYCLSPKCGGKLEEGELVDVPRKKMRELSQLVEDRLASLPELINPEYEKLWESPSSDAHPEKRQIKFFKHIWREQVLGDAELRYQARVVAFWLADWMDKREGVRHFIKTKKEIVIYPGQVRLAQKVGCAQAEISRALKAISEQFHMVPVKRGLADAAEKKLSSAFTSPNEYVMILEPNRTKRERLCACAYSEQSLSVRQ